MRAAIFDTGGDRMIEALTLILYFSITIYMFTNPPTEKNTPHVIFALGIAVGLTLADVFK